jgi:predicted SprT family Zn-dependent metalloprotease
MMSAQEQMQRRQQITDKCNALIAVANDRLGITLPPIAISFRLRGTCAGMAKRRGTRYSMEFNGEMITREAFDHVINDTVPHELAHIVCFAFPRFGKNHDGGWAHICRTLGGSGARTHNEDVVYAKGRTFEYTSTTGHKHNVSEQRHRKIQAPGNYYVTYRHGGGRVDKTCAFALYNPHGPSIPVPARVQPIKPNIAVDMVINKILDYVPTSPARPSIDAPPPAAFLVKHIVAPDVQPIVPVQARAIVPPKVAPRIVMHAPTAAPGTSKAAQARAIMQRMYAAGSSYEAVIAEIMRVTGHARQLARATYKANAPKIGIPEQY